jgi:alkylated DNA repair dioxygenase AlkB
LSAGTDPRGARPDLGAGKRLMPSLPELIQAGTTCETKIMAESVGLFTPDTPPGFHYRDNFISLNDELELIKEIGTLAFSDFELRGVVARRRVAFFGQAYDREVVGPLPEFLLPLRAAIARWAEVDPDAFAMALINEYRPGTPIGWHRDAPQYDIVAGVSLLSSCRMKFRPYRSPAIKAAGERRSATHELVLARRSAYLLTRESRSAFEHHIPPVAELRYSITYRTLR